MPTIKTVDYVDLEKFSGNWYVIANIPTFIEKNAYNAVESYKLDDDGTIATTFTFNKGGFDGPKKTYNPRGFVWDKKSNAVWGMQFLWPIKAEYLVIYLDKDYSNVIIGRSKLDYVWIMSRKPQIPDAEYKKLIEFLKKVGYDTDKIQKVPQKWD